MSLPFHILDSLPKQYSQNSWFTMIRWQKPYKTDSQMTSSNPKSHKMNTENWLKGNSECAQFSFTSNSNEPYTTYANSEQNPRAKLKQDYSLFWMTYSPSEPSWRINAPSAPRMQLRLYVNISECTWNWIRTIRRLYTLTITSHKHKTGVIDNTSTQGCHYFSTVSYTHLDVYKRQAFMHEVRCYRFTVTPFGLSTSSAALTRGLDVALEEEVKKNTIIYLSLIHI